MLLIGGPVVSSAPLSKVSTAQKVLHSSLGGKESQLALHYLLFGPC